MSSELSVMDQENDLGMLVYNSPYVLTSSVVNTAPTGLY